MLLSIDRVLQLVSEGKNIEKIAELAKCETGDVIALINEARELLAKHEKTFSKRKVIIKKKVQAVSDYDQDRNQIRELLNGAELAAIPVNTPLTMNIASVSNGNPGHSGIGILIFDQENRQVGKISDYTGQRTVSGAEHALLIRALKLAVYFQVSELKIRTDSEVLIRQMNPDFKTKDSEIMKFLSETRDILKKIEKYKIEQIAKNLNDKALFLAKKAADRVQEKSR